MNIQALEADGIRFACSAVEYDQKGYIDEAIFFYREAYQALSHAAAAGSKLDCYQKAKEYSERINVLIKMKNNYMRNARQPTPPQQQPSRTNSAEQNASKTAKFMIDQALHKDENNKDEDAMETYVDAAGFCLKMSKQPEIASTPTSKQLLKMANFCIERSEAIKKKINKTPKPDATEKPLSESDQLALLAQLDDLKPFSEEIDGVSQEGSDDVSQEDPHGVNQSPAERSGGQSSASRLTPEEIRVLTGTSFINGREYLPFISADVRDNFHFRTGFTDKHGLLELSQKQQRKLKAWKRPQEFMKDPKMIMCVSSFSIKQTLVSDCSFIASLAISAAYERKFNKKLITKIIYPQNSKGEPIYNPCGRYIVKLHFNGCYRKVVVDDRFPVDSTNNLLCSYSSNRNELWVSLIEKAYMKVMGGYDFPGSTSNYDLHALTGWIPERQSLRDKTCNYDQFFEKLKVNLHNGRVLATISVGDIPEQEAERAGLVPTHAYAILDVQFVHGKKLLQVKNPWSHLRWKGNFSANDEANWTPELLKTLQYDINTAKEVDNGVFWIDWDSALHFFDVVYMNWNPRIFACTKCYHCDWLAKDGPQKETFSLANNPQYRLDVTTKVKTVVWVLLSRHITEKEDFANNREFISLLVYKNDGRKVYYPYDPPPYIDGTRINSPHYLCKINVEEGSHKLTLVVSQYEKHKNISFTIRTYAPLPVKINKIPDFYKASRRIQGEWKGITAGGCKNNRETYRNNPCYQIKLKQMGETHCLLLIELRAPKKYSSGFDVICVETNADKPFNRESSGVYRTGYSMWEMKVPCGIYNIIPCTFQNNQEGHFFLDVKTSFNNFDVNMVKQ